jgi:hypothetical protein
MYTWKRQEIDTNFYYDNLKERDHFRGLGVGGRITLKSILKKQYRVYEGVDWIHLAQDRDQWRSLVYTIMNLRAS